MDNTVSAFAVRQTSNGEWELVTLNPNQIPDDVLNNAKSLGQFNSYREVGSHIESLLSKISPSGGSQGGTQRT